MSRAFSNYQNQDFVDNVVVHSGILNDAVNWIASNLDIDDVFEESDVVSYVKGSQLGPEELFEEEVLAEWAEQNGFVKFYG